ncbi:hypothetical protein JNUCC1_01373 [Lentibacillus sp. JNUCC-1]|nr:hypothetical protein [Lentibacillus sp. JNUCC-1]
MVGITLTSAIMVYRLYFFSFSGLEGEHYKAPLPSPDGQYTADAYYNTYGGAAGGVNVWVDVTDHNNGDHVKTIYLGNAKEQFSLKWTDGETLYIQNETSGNNKYERSIELNVMTEIYHDTGLACQSLLLKETYETCYEHE